VTFWPNKDEFEPTSGPSMSGMVCVVSCPTLLVEGEPHQYINPSAKCISNPRLTPLREARMKAQAGLVRVRVLLNVRVELSHIWNWGVILIYSKCMSRVVIEDGLTHNDSRFILVQTILPYVQSGVDRMYYLSPDARESLGSYKLSSGG
jgi:hypothetical protein